MATDLRSDLLNGLNEPQQSAVQCTEGPLLIIAGPGSGKTRVITHRIAYMIASGIPSHHIVALTFTNKAADEMRNRLARLAPKNLTWAGTFHKFCARLLRRHAPMVGLQENFTIYDMGDSRSVLKQAIGNAEVDLRHYSPDKLANEISNLKNNGLSHERFVPRPGNALDNILRKVYPEYQKLLQMANGVDFDDLLLHCVELLRESPELRESLDRKFAYMMVDEYQDTNLSQYQLIRLLNLSVQNLAVTGDPDQSIYGWRGANIRNILEFEKDYPDVTVARLEENYRSTKAILSVADQLIGNNVNRKQKRLLTDNDQGEPVRLVTFKNPQEEGLDIADRISLSIERGESRPRDYAILYRANWLSRSLEHALRASGIPYQVVNGHEFYQRKEIKDLVAYLHLLNNPRDNVAFERVINTPSRKIGKVTVGRLRRHSQENNISMLEAARNCADIASIKASPTAKFTKFLKMYDSLAEHVHANVETIIREILAATGYRDWLTDDGSEEGFERAGNVDELVVAAQEFDNEHPDDGGLERYLEQAALVSDTDVFESNADFVTLMTMHASKGLEFPSVFIVGLEEGLLPHERSTNDDNEVEEERRLFFVGITRAEKHLQLSRCMSRFRRGSYWPAIASRFLMELPRSEMTIFEPRQLHAMSEDELQAAIDNIDGWSNEPADELPSIDINSDLGSNPISLFEPPESEVQDSTDESPDQVQEAPVVAGKKLNGLPPMMTAAQLEEKQQAMLSADRLEPESCSIGMEVEHVDYGVGKVIALSGKGKKLAATINFPKHGNKRIILAFSNLRSAEA
jgi:DNA helicase-2/ATP-dependent DNA helicase PcrA